MIVVMGAHYFMRPDEIILDHAVNTNDKTLVAVEGARYSFTPCSPYAAAEALPANHYGDTTLFDYVDGWLTDAGRF